MTTVTAFQSQMASQYGANALHQALQDNKTASALAFKSMEQAYRNSGVDNIVNPDLMKQIRDIVAAHVAQQAAQAAVVAKPAPIAPARASRCTTPVIAVAVAVLAAATGFLALQNR